MLVNDLLLVGTVGDAVWLRFAVVCVLVHSCVCAVPFVFYYCFSLVCMGRG